MPSIFGLKPPVYLGLLYGAALLLALFLLLVYPGLSKPGSIGIFNSEPAGAAVRIDDITLGFTPCRIFIPAGSRNIEFVLPGFNPDKQKLDINGKIFGSLFFPSKITIAGKLVCPDPAGTLAQSAIEYMYWAAAGEGSAGFQNPLCLSEGIYRVGSSARDPAIRETMQEILNNSLRHAVTGVSVRDILRAQFFLDNNGLSPSPFSMISSLQKIVLALGNNSASSQWLAKVVPEEAAKKLLQSEWFKTNTVFPSSIESIDLPVSVPSSMSLGAVSFVSVSSGYLEKYGCKEIMPPMLIASSPVSRESWELFTEENREWADKDALISRGLVGEDYLIELDYPSFPETAVPGISWYAAKAYCEWLNTKLPPSLIGWELRLPSEAEWEYAVRFAELDTGMLWEWCGDPYAPLDFFPANMGIMELFEKAALHYPLERTLRGSSWINTPQLMAADIESRGSLPPEISSPFIGFRPVIVPKQVK